MEKVTVQVTKSEIERGMRKCACYCPVALALMRLGFQRPEVVVASTPDYPAPVSYKLKLPNLEDGGRVYIPLSLEVDQRIFHYDMTGEMEPFEFEFELPESF